MEGTNVGLYYAASDLSIVAVDDLGDEIYLYIYFPGKTVGKRDQLDEVYVIITREYEGGTVYYWGGLTEENTDVNLNITRYDDVGGVIEGTFSGTFLVQDENEAFTGETVTVTEGKFSVQRYPDPF